MSAEPASGKGGASDRCSQHWVIDAWRAVAQAWHSCSTADSDTIGRASLKGRPMVTKLWPVGNSTLSKEGTYMHFPQLLRCNQPCLLSSLCQFSPNPAMHNCNHFLTLDLPSPCCLAHIYSCVCSTHTYTNHILLLFLLLGC